VRHAQLTILRYTQSWDQQATSVGWYWKHFATQTDSCRLSAHKCMVRLKLTDLRNRQNSCASFLTVFCRTIQTCKYLMLVVPCGWNLLLKIALLLPHWCVCRVISGCYFVFVFISVVCPHSERKMIWAINTKLGTHIVHGRMFACIDPEVKRSRSQGCQMHYHYACITA